MARKKTTRPPGRPPVGEKAMTGAERMRLMKERRAVLDFRMAQALVALRKAAPDVDVDDDIIAWATDQIETRKLELQAEALARTYKTKSTRPADVRAALTSEYKRLKSETDPLRAERSRRERIRKETSE